MSEKTWSGAIEFFTDSKGNIEPVIRLGEHKTVLWAKVLGTVADAFVTDAPMLLQLARAVNDGVCHYVDEENDDDAETSRAH